MKHTYNIQGMICNGCLDHVKQRLSKIDSIISVSVNLEKGEAIIVMESHIATNTLQKALPKKYTISKKNSFENTNPSSIKTYTEDSLINKKSKLQQLKPLFIILLYILVASILFDKSNWNGQQIMLNFMGLFFIVFSFFKILDLKGFRDSFKMYDPLAKIIPAYAAIYPFIETALGLLFLLRLKISIAIIITILILGITSIGVSKILVSKKSIQCACLGTVLKLPMTEATFIENAIMIIMAISMLITIF